MTMPPVFLELFVLALGILILVLESFAEKQDRKLFAIIGIVGLAIVFLVLQASGPGPSGMASYVADSAAIFFKKVSVSNDDRRPDHVDRLRRHDQAFFARRFSSIRSWRVFRAADPHLRRDDVDVVSDRLYPDFRIPGVGHDFFLCPCGVHAPERCFSGSRRQIPDPERPCHRLSPFTASPGSMASRGRPISPG